AGWGSAQSLPTLKDEEIPVEMVNGNWQGYAKGRQIAINPVAQMPDKTTFHELAHIELGHTSEAVHDSETLPRSLKEVEAESVALLCLESLRMDGAEYCRGYIQNWLAGAAIPKRSAHRILAAATRFLRLVLIDHGKAVPNEQRPDWHGEHDIGRTSGRLCSLHASFNEGPGPNN